MTNHTHRHSQGVNWFGKFFFRPFKRVGWVAEYPDCWAVIWIERRPWRESATLMWNVFKDCDREDFLEGSHRLKEEMAVRRQDGAKVRMEKRAHDCHYVLLLAFINLTCSQNDGIPEWTVQNCADIHMFHMKACYGFIWNMLTIILYLWFFFI